MESKDSIEVAIRAAGIARDVLKMIDIGNPRIAMMQLHEAARQMKELDDRLNQMMGVIPRASSNCGAHRQGQTR